MVSLIFSLEKQLMKKARPFSKNNEHVQKSKLSPALQQRYLEHIGFTAEEIGLMKGDGPTLAWLREIHYHHLLTVPFENLDMHKHPAAGSEFRRVSKKSLAETIEEAVEKIVNQKRGGVCYEVTLAFTALLRSLGYDVRVTLGQVFTKNGTYVPYATHFVPIITTTNGVEYVADCGLGQPARELMPIQPGVVVTDSLQAQYAVAEIANSNKQQDSMFSQVVMYRPGPSDRASNADGNETDTEYKLLQSKTNGGTYTQQELADLGFQTWYRFYPRGDFDMQCTAFHLGCMLLQNTNLTWFTQFTLVSRVTEAGLVTLSAKNLTVTTNGVVEKIAINGLEEWRRALRERFGIEL